jgi:flagellar basal body rod protein FlgG
MSDNSILSIARTGVQNGLDGIQKNASQLASKDALASGMTDASPVSAVNEMVDMKMNQYQVIASGKVIETVDQMLGTLLDEKV